MSDNGPSEDGQMSDDQLAEFEALCTDMLVSGHSQKEAEEALREYTEEPNLIPQLQFVLERSTNVSALSYAITCLTGLITQHWNLFDTADRVVIRDYLVDYLQSNGLDVPANIRRSIIHLLARITKLGWYLDNGLRDILDIMQDSFMDSDDIQMYTMAMDVLQGITEEISKNRDGFTSLEGPKVGGYRRTVASYCDTALLRVFQMSLAVMNNLHGRGYAELNDDQLDLLGAAMRLCAACVGYNFAGIRDETLENPGAVLVPMSWSELFIERTMVTMLFDAYNDTDLKEEALTCLMSICWVRSTLFPKEQQRDAFLGWLLEGTFVVIDHMNGMDDPQCFREFCRLLDRITYNFRSAEIRRMPEFVDWVNQVAQFTEAAFRDFQDDDDALYYLLQLWSRMLRTVRLMNSVPDPVFESFPSQLLEAFLQSRLDQVADDVRTDRDLQLNDAAEDMSTQLDAIKVISRVTYQTAGEYALELLTSTAHSFRQSVRDVESSRGADEADVLRMREDMASLVYVVHVIGAMVGGRYGAPKPDEDVLDAVLMAELFDLMRWTDKHYAGNGELQDIHSMEPLELAYLYSMRRMRDVYPGDMIIANNRFCQEINERMGFKESHELPGVIWNRCYANFANWDSRILLERTLELLANLTSGSRTPSELLKLDILDDVFRRSGTFETVPFFNDPSLFKLRTSYHKTLATVCFGYGHSEGEEEIFEEFVAPIGEQLDLIAEVGESDPDDLLTDEARDTVIGVLRDLRGILQACTVRSFPLFFEWFSAYFELMANLVTLYADDPSVTSPLLKVLYEMTRDANDRLSGNWNSPYGILLFQQTSRLVHNYAEQLIDLDIADEDKLYSHKYKGITLCMRILDNTIVGKYINFSVFEIFEDESFANILAAILTLLVSIPMEHVMVYPKLTTAYYHLLDMLFVHHRRVLLLQLSDELLLQLFEALLEGFRSYDAMVIGHCVTALNSITALFYRYREHPGSKEEAQALMAVLDSEPGREVLPNFLQALMHIVLFQGYQGMWMMCSPLLALSLTHEDEFDAIKEDIIAGQPGELHEQMLEEFELLFEKVENSMGTRNRNTFHQNLVRFRRAMKHILIV